MAKRRVIAENKNALSGKVQHPWNYWSHGWYFVPYQEAIQCSEEQMHLQKKVPSNKLSSVLWTRQHDLSSKCKMAWFNSQCQSVHTQFTKEDARIIGWWDSCSWGQLISIVNTSPHPCCRSNLCCWGKFQQSTLQCQSENRTNIWHLSKQGKSFNLFATSAPWKVFCTMKSIVHMTKKKYAHTNRLSGKLFGTSMLELWYLMGNFCRFTILDRKLWYQKAAKNVLFCTSWCACVCTMLPQACVTT